MNEEISPAENALRKKRVPRKSATLLIGLREEILSGPDWSGVKLKHLDAKRMKS